MNSNLSEIFNTEEKEKIGNVANAIENREYTKEECNKFVHSISDYIMSKSYKNGDMDNAREEFSGILRKFQNLI